MAKHLTRTYASAFRRCLYSGTVVGGLVLGFGALVVFLVRVGSARLHEAAPGFVTAYRPSFAVPFTLAVFLAGGATVLTWLAVRPRHVREHPGAVEGLPAFGRPWNGSSDLGPNDLDNRADVRAEEVLGGG